jgi:hypothetical protein
MDDANRIPPPPTEPASPPITPPAAPLVPIPEAPEEPPLSAHGSAMKRRGPVLVWLLWPFLTLGIYHLAWYYKIHNELKRYDRSQVNLSPVGSMLVMLLLGWTVVAPLISYYNTGEAIAKAQRRAGLPVTCSPIASMLLWFVFGLNVFYIQRQLNLIVDEYPGAQHGEDVPLPAAYYLSEIPPSKR